MPPIRAAKSFKRYLYLASYQEPIRRLFRQLKRLGQLGQLGQLEQLKQLKQLEQ